MALSQELLDQLVKATKPAEKKPTEATVYGTTVSHNGKLYVQIDGSDVLTPVASTVKMKSGERVMVQIKDHSAVVTGNLSTAGQSARSDDVDDIVNEIAEFEIVIADKVSTGELDAEKARIDELVAENATIMGRIEASEALISELEAENATITGTLTAHEADITKLSAEKLDAEFAEITYATIENLTATNAQINNLEATYGDFVELTAERFEALDAEIVNLEAEYATIDFANIGEAAIANLIATSGIIGDLIVSEGNITDTLTAVGINADWINAGTLKAERLVLLGEDGLFHEINVAAKEAGGITEGEVVPDDSIHGSIITAKSITATQIFVDDLIAFDATIGGFNIGTNSLYSGVKESIDNSTRGIYMDTDGQVYFGDDNNYICYYKDVDEAGNEVYKLAISAETILFGANSKTSAADLKALTEHIKMGTYVDDTGDERPSIELAEGDSDFKQVITNTETMFMDGDTVKTRVDTEGVDTNNLSVRGESRHGANGNWVWAERANGNYGLIWKEVAE